MQAKEIKPGTVVNYQGAPVIIESVNVQTPSARGAATLYKFRGRNLVSKQKTDITLRGSESLDEADFGRRSVKLMYTDPTHVHVMDDEDYNQYSIPREYVEQELGYITESQADRVRARIKESKAAAHKIPGYKILGKLGAGAMAVVYKARQLSLNREVAIKVLPKRFSENPEYVERFYKEGQAAGKLNHPNIVQAFDVGEAGGYHYFVIEYVEGRTLADDLTAGKVFAEREAVEVYDEA